MACREAGGEDKTLGAGEVTTTQQDDAWKHGEDGGGEHRDDRQSVDVEEICCEKVGVPTPANRWHAPPAPPFAVPSISVTGYRRPRDAR